jgi:peroxiredoxin
MKSTIGLILATSVALVFTVATVSAVKVGEPAPAFTGTDNHGNQVMLSDFRGKFVVLEWHNNGCPYVGKQYNSGNMQKLQREWTAKGVVWLTIISSAPGKQGYVTPEQSQAYVAEKKAVPTAVLLDPTGNIGRLYNAKTTPHMFVIDPAGRLIYDGAIDDKPTTDLADVATATDYVSAALTEAMAGKTVTTATSRPYGCSVKYSDAR